MRMASTAFSGKTTDKWSIPIMCAENPIRPIRMMHTNADPNAVRTMPISVRLAEIGRMTLDRSGPVSLFY